MLFNLNEFLISISFALDFVEMDIFGVVTNHSKRVAYISMRIAEKLGLSQEEIFDIISLSILHDNGASHKRLHNSLHKSKEDLLSIESQKEHGIKGEENIKEYPFLTNVDNVIKYHHENYDGTGFFGIIGEEIPIMSQIIKLADTVELNCNLNEMYIEDKGKILSFLRNNENTIFSSKLVYAFTEISQIPAFWLDLRDDFINFFFQRNMPKFSIQLPLCKIHNITKIFSNIVDSKSRFTQLHSTELSEKARIMGRFYNKPIDEIYKIMIAADLHDIGKLAISNDILDKPTKLNDREFDIIKQHSYFTRLSLQQIHGFEDITEWASNHHEKLNGKGYPLGKNRDELDFNSRLIACLDVYQALMEERPYRKAMTQYKATKILREMIKDGSLDEKITNDIIVVFST
ncbi:MAG: HD family phosphohydrolase [Firmicutes bacterium HGW-Firmicutes-7]|nr:MAG: HD family phosphohydrolase [Firmicutes bacterium HGW-Firmicutes-7]